MGKVLLAFSMSLDGFIAGPEVGVDHPMGKGGERLHDWMRSDTNKDETDAAMGRELHEKAGAVVLGRRTFDIGVGLWEDTPYPVPSFVLTHRSRDALPMKSATFTFVTDGIESALRHARTAGGGKDVIVMGADAGQQCLRAGLADEMFIQLVPVLLGAGSRAFDNVGAGHIELKSTRVLDSPSVTHLRFEIRK
jgi:dihydrofolate reductase